MDVQIPCPCPPKADGTPRHEHDTVTLKDTLGFRERLSLRHTITWAKDTTPGITEGELLGVLTEGYVLQCVTGWSLMDEKGKALPPSRENVVAFLEDHPQEALVVADAADDLYSKVVLLPLLLVASSSSPATPTPPGQPDPSTSAPTNGQTHRKPSKRSSISASPMVVTGPMLASPAGVSNS